MKGGGILGRGVSYLVTWQTVSVGFLQEYEELNNKLNDFKEREQELRERLQNYRRQNHSESDENTNVIAATKQKHSYTQNTSSPLPKSSPHGHSNQTMQQAVSSPSTNLVQNLDRNGGDANNVLSNINTNFESSDDNVNDVIGRHATLMLIHLLEIS